MTPVRSPSGSAGSPPDQESAWSQPARLVSVDVARGVAIATMLIVNHPGSWGDTYGTLQHADWHGATLADLVFPLFLFVAGVSCVLSVDAATNRGVGRREIMLRSARRSAFLVLLGLGLVTFPWWQLDPYSMRFPGVLQRIGVSLLIATPVVLWLRVRAQALAAAALLLGYWAVMQYFPVPGVGAAVWEPGQDFAAYLDRLLLGANHLMHESWDPLGVLGTLPAAGNVLLGALAAHWIRHCGSRLRLVAGLTVAGTAAIAIGWLWGLVFPINKNLWTSSYAVFATGWSLLVLAVCYWVFEGRGDRRRWAQPLAALGMNAILIYCLAVLVDNIAWRVRIGSGASIRSAVYRIAFESWLAPIHASLAFAIAFLIAWILVAMVLVRAGFKVRV